MLFIISLLMVMKLVSVVILVIVVSSRLLVRVVRFSVSRLVCSYFFRLRMKVICLVGLLMKVFWLLVLMCVL